MKSKLRVLVTSSETCEGAWRGQERKLKQLYELSDKRYELVNQPEFADIILIGLGDLRKADWIEKILSNDLLNKYPNKCFSLSNQYAPMLLNRGIYISGSKSFFTSGRIRTGSYTLYPEEYLNPFIQKHSFTGVIYHSKSYLLSFIGRKSHSVRERIFNLKFNRSDILIEDSSTFKLWKDQGKAKIERQKYFYEVLLNSKFSLCPRGSAANSIRLFESLQLGIAPVIVADKWTFPTGIQWNKFSVVIKEKNIHELEKIVQTYESSYKEMGDLARKAFEENFSEHSYFNYVVKNCIEIKNKQLFPESLYWNLNPLVFKLSKLRKKIGLKSKIQSILYS